MNYGFINHNNDANEMPLWIVLDEKNDEGYELKVKLRNDKKDSLKFRVVDNLQEQVMLDFIGFARY